MLHIAQSVRQMVIDLLVGKKSLTFTLYDEVF